LNIKELETTLRTPEKYRNYLRSKGALDFFVKAVALGKDELAKWTLLESSKLELDEIMKGKSL